MTQGVCPAKHHDASFYIIIHPFDLIFRNIVK